jgi:hypothetical protein
MSDDDLEDYGTRRQRRMRVVAWVVIASLILAGGGATVFSLFA